MRAVQRTPVVEDHSSESSARDREKEEEADQYSLSSCAPRRCNIRAEDPPNKVYVQFSDNFEGFLPYTLLITEEQGLMFTSLFSFAADFALDPMQFITISRISYDALMRDSFFLNLSRSISARPELQQQRGRGDAELGERIRPPYPSLVQVNVRRYNEGQQVLVFIAVQNDPLANDLVRGCHLLKKRRTVRVVNDGREFREMNGEGVPQRPKFTNEPQRLHTPSGRGHPTSRQRALRPAQSPSRTPPPCVSRQASQVSVLGDGGSVRMYAKMMGLSQR